MISQLYKEQPMGVGGNITKLCCFCFKILGVERKACLANILPLRYILCPGETVCKVMTTIKTTSDKY